MVMLDPLQTLPTEVVLRITEFVPVSGLAALTRSGKHWHRFLETHQEAIYSQQAQWIYWAKPRSDREVLPLGRDLSSFGHGQDKSFVQYFKGVDSWKDFCKRFTLLEKNWNSKNPVVRESVIQVGNDPVWRFKPDFKRRLLISTSQSGGVNVTDMRTGRSLWRLGRDEVRLCAHLEYDQESGTACWDRFGNAIEVWKADEVERGTFHRTAILNHDCETRGFQLSRFDGKETLCVVSSEGQAFVWDLSQNPPEKRITIEIENEAVGHLDQGKDTIMCSLGAKGYHVHSKDTGERMGTFQPKECRNIYHITHPAALPATTIATSGHGPSPVVFPPQNPRKDRFTPLRLHEGPHPAPASPLDLENDEWGSGMISGNFMAGVSRGGRIFVCTDYKGALADPARFGATTAILHTQGDGSTFEMGGWLNIKNGRIIFEIGDRVYTFTLPDEGHLPAVGPEQRRIWATPTSSAPQLTVPVSFMGVYDDCLMHTYTASFPCHSVFRTSADTEQTLGWREPPQGTNLSNRRPRAFPTKAIRVLSLAPDMSAGSGHELDFIPGSEGEDEDASEGLVRRGSNIIQAHFLQLVSLLVGHEEDVEDGDGEEEEEEDGDGEGEEHIDDGAEAREGASQFTHDPELDEALDAHRAEVLARGGTEGDARVEHNAQVMAEGGHWEHDWVDTDDEAEDEGP